MTGTEGKALPRVGKVRTGVFDGQFFSPANGKDVPGGKGLSAPQGSASRQAGKVNTLWGWVAWSLAGQAGYDIVRKDDEARVAPGGDDILKLLGDEANLIRLDEVLEYLISAGGTWDRSGSKKTAKRRRESSPRRTRRDAV